MAKETKEKVLAEARDLAKDVYCLEDDEIRDMSKVYKIVDHPSTRVSMILGGVAPDMADVPSTPHVLEGVLQHTTDENFDAEYMWTAESSLNAFTLPEEGVLTGEEIINRLDEVKDFLGKNPKKALVFVDDDGFYLVKERPTTLHEVKTLRSHLRAVQEEDEAEMQRADAAQDRQKKLDELVKTADTIGLENAIAKLKE